MRHPGSGELRQRSVKQLSGGERRRVALALALGFSELAAQRGRLRRWAGRSLGFLACFVFLWYGGSASWRRSAGGCAGEQNWRAGGARWQLGS